MPRLADRVIAVAPAIRDGAVPAPAAGYHATRLAHDARRDVVWKALWRHVFRHRVAAGDTVLDLGCGYGEFINNVTARRRIGLDQWPGIDAHLAPGVERIVAPTTDLSGIADGSVDYAFASNLFEHLPQAAFARVLEQLAAKLALGGRLTILQPNYRYAWREYFDDYTHVAIWSHVAIVDFLAAHGWEAIEVRPRFLPLSVKSRWPVSPLLIAAYLRSPVKPGGKQMLIVARPVRHGG